MKRTTAFLFALTFLAAVGCRKGTGTDIPDIASSLQQTEAEKTADHPSGETETESAGIVSEPELSKTDLATSWDESAVIIAFSGNQVTPSVSDGVSVENGVISITKGGTYVLSGSLENGRTVVNLEDRSEKVHLILNGVSVHAEQNAPLIIQNADKAVITLADQTQNMMSDSGEEQAKDDSDTAKACIFSTCDLTINGTGSLTVNGKVNNGIYCKDDLKIVSGTISVDAVNHGIRGNDSVLIHSGVVTVKAGGDGIKTTAADKEGKGRIVIQSGDVSVISSQDGLDAATDLMVSGGCLSVESGGGTANAKQHKSEGFGFGGRFSFDDFGQGQTEESAPSRKGLKAANSLLLKGGTVSVNSADDAVHTDGSAGICGNAILDLNAGDDGIHADQQLCIAENASVTVSESYEGLEAYEIIISGGETHIHASDDGVNAAGTTENGSNSMAENLQIAFEGREFGGMNRRSGGKLTISGGYLYVNADGDGIDSNGDIEMTGGTAVICGPTSNFNGPLDCGDFGNSIRVTGGTLIAVGSTGMMDVPEENYIASIDLNADSGTLIAVTDSDGKVLGVLRTPKNAAGVIFSANGISDGYNIYSGGKYDGTLNEDGFGSGGSYSGGKLVKSGNGGGMGSMRPGQGFGTKENPFEGDRPKIPKDG